MIKRLWLNFLKHLFMVDLDSLNCQQRPMLPSSRKRITLDLIGFSAEIESNLESPWKSLRTGLDEKGVA